MGWEHSRFARFLEPVPRRLRGRHARRRDAAHRVLLRPLPLSQPAALLATAPRLSADRHERRARHHRHRAAARVHRRHQRRGDRAGAWPAIGVRIVRRTSVADQPGRHPRRRGGGPAAAPARCSPPAAWVPRATTSASGSSPSCSARRSSSTRRVWADAGRAVRPLRPGAGRRATEARPRCPGGPSSCRTGGAPRRASGSRAARSRDHAARRARRDAEAARARGRAAPGRRGLRVG